MRKQALNIGSENGGSPLRVVRRLRRHVHRMTGPHEVAVRRVDPFDLHPSNKHQQDREGERFSRAASSRPVPGSLQRPATSRVTRAARFLAVQCYRAGPLSSAMAG